jgi:hypothetical protein
MLANCSSAILKLCIDIKIVTMQHCRSNLHNVACKRHGTSTTPTPTHHISTSQVNPAPHWTPHQRSHTSRDPAIRSPSASSQPSLNDWTGRITAAQHAPGTLRALKRHDNTVKYPILPACRMPYSTFLDSFAFPYCIFIVVLFCVFCLVIRWRIFCAKLAHHGSAGKIELFRFGTE